MLTLLRFDGDIAIGMHRQWSQCRAVQLLKHTRAPVTGQLFEQALVEFVQQRPDALVELGKRERRSDGAGGPGSTLDVCTPPQPAALSLGL